MTKPARTIAAFGLYLIVTGAILVCIPNVLLTVLRVELAEEPWIRVLGAVVAVLGFYYITAAKTELDSFFRATLWGRNVILVMFLTLVLLQVAPAQLVVFGVIDALGALWTWAALRSSASAT